MRQSFFYIVLLILFFPTITFAIDTDADGLSDDMERIYYTDIANPDTDGDGYSDGMEIAHGYSPHASSSLRMDQYDYDHDGLNDALERWFGSDMGKSDSDNDGYTDFDEVMFGYSPTQKETTKRFLRHIVVDRTKQWLNYYVDGVVVARYPVSTGNPYSETPAGEFTIGDMIETKRYTGPGYDLPNVKWNMEFLPYYYIHAAYWHHDFGKRTHSHGCVNMAEKDAKELYRYMRVGIPVEVIGQTPKRFVVGT